MLRGLWKYRELLYTLVRRDLIVRYQSSFLGIFWSFTKPLAMMFIFWFAFSLILRIPMPNPKVNFSLHLIVGLMVWNFFSRCIMEGMNAVMSHAHLIKKVYVPVEVFPATTVLGNLINLFLGMLVLFPIILFWMSREIGYNITQAPLEVLLSLVVTLQLALLGYALALIVSAVNVFFRDLESLMDLLLQAWFYATPIVYPISLLYGDNSVFNRFGPFWGRALEITYWMNPITPIVLAFRRILLYRDILEIDDQRLLYGLQLALVETVLLLIVGHLVFRFCSRRFVDEL